MGLGPLISDDRRSQVFYLFVVVAPFPTALYLEFKPSYLRLFCESPLHKFLTDPEPRSLRRARHAEEFPNHASGAPVYLSDGLNRSVSREPLGLLVLPFNLQHVHQAGLGHRSGILSLFGKRLFEKKTTLEVLAG